MRWSLCALLLLLVPSPAFAQLAIQFTTPANPTVTGPTLNVAGTVSNATGTPTVTVDDVAATVTQSTDPNTPNDWTWSAQSVPLVAGSQTLTAKVIDDVDTQTATLGVDAHLFIDVSAPSTPPATPIVTTRTGVRFTGKVVVSDVPADSDPNSITFALRGLTTPLDPNFAFSQFVKIAAGTSIVFLTASDGDPNHPTNSFLTSYNVTRTVVCDDNPNDPNFPTAIAPDPGSLGSAFSYSVDRSDDLPNEDPSSIDCEVRQNSDGTLSFTPPVGHCTLRAAIQASNVHHQMDPNAPGDRIFIGPRHIVLRRKGAHEDHSDTGDLDIRGDLRLIGNGRDVTTIDARGLGDRVIDVGPGVKLQLFDLTLSGGQAPPAPDPNTPQVGAGGCLRDFGTLLAVNTAFLSCGATTDGGAILQDAGSARLTCAIVARGKSRHDGGGIMAVLDLENATLSLNSAGDKGGAIAQQSIATAQPSFTLKNGTLTGNSAKLTGGVLELGANNQATINNTTFSGNRAKAGSTLSGGAAVTISNSILGDTAKLGCDPNAPETITSGGGNVERGDSCLKVTGAHDLVNTDPKLGGLASNNPSITSGLPPTQKLMITSPAIDFAGVQTPCTGLDARDTERFDWPGLGLTDPNELAVQSPPFCDSGSFELSAPGAQPP
jgi:hypothetical protein